MYNIDLLKGQGIPIKHRRGGMWLVLLTFVVPVVLAGLFYWFYLNDSIEQASIAIKLADRQKKIDDLAPAVEYKKLMESKCDTIRACLKDVAGQMHTNECWSDVLKTVVENVPASMFVSKIDVRLNNVSKSEADKKDPTKMITVQYMVRTLRMSLVGNPQKVGIDAVRKFVASLDSSEKLSQSLEDVRIISQQEQQQQETAGKMRYDIDCVFKAQKI